jgi:hypothetical protein
MAWRLGGKPTENCKRGAANAAENRDRVLPKEGSMLDAPTYGGQTRHCVQGEV